jgi:hypothetical protein
LAAVEETLAAFSLTDSQLWRRVMARKEREAAYRERARRRVEMRGVAMAVVAGGGRGSGRVVVLMLGFEQSSDARPDKVGRVCACVSMNES